MTLAQVRRSRGETLEQVAEQCGLRRSSKGYLSRIENGASAPIPIAIRLEEWSDGALKAVDLVDPKDRPLLNRWLERAISAAASAPA